MATNRGSVRSGGAGVLIVVAALALAGCDAQTWQGGSCASASDCAPLTGATVECAAGACSYTCAEYRADCDGDRANGCEADLRAATSCGSCTAQCLTGAACDASTLVPECRCPAGLAECGGRCVDTSSDLDSCGTCGAACAPANATGACEDGACRMAACAPGWSDCDGDPSNGCEADLGSAATCGACDLQCGNDHGGADRRCDATAVPPACTTTCPPSAAPCGDTCADVSSDPHHCGGCDACTLPHAVPACVDGACRIAECAAGWADCNGDAADGCEQRLDDSEHCGACGAACGPLEACVPGGGTVSCVSSCPPGTAVCGLSCVDTASDAAHCGGCDQRCVLPGATSACRDGACEVRACDQGLADCDQLAANGCETPLGTVSDCLSCFDACTYPNASASCTAAGCALAACTPGHASCNDLDLDGCERDLRTDVGHCGSCGHACSSAGGTASCVAGSCQIACDAGFASCDGSVDTGCEQPLDTLAHCGACYRACSFPYASASCASGTCTLAACNAGRADCDGLSATGCEVNVGADLNNCGACGRRCSLANAVAACANGTCAIASCSPGWYDRDRDPANGCESQCSGTDQPDDAFEDTNCDGIDGDAAHAVFVSPSGNDAWSGLSKAQPKRTLEQAIARVRQLGPENYDIYAAGGTYGVSSTLTVYAGVSIYGGYDPVTWARDDAHPAVISKTGSADANGRVTVLSCATVDIQTVFDRVTLKTEDATTPSADNVAVTVSNCLGLRFNRATIQAGRGGAGAGGADGAKGRDGQAGGTGWGGSCDSNSCGALGAGGEGCYGLYDRGGEGGEGGCSGSWDGSPGDKGCGPVSCADRQGGDGGSGGAEGNPGKDGGDGSDGPTGTMGNDGAGGAAGAAGASGSAGWNGAGGGGGGGGGGQTCTLCDNGRGNAGGGGGGSGCGGSAGTGGQPGGDSIALEIAAGTMSGRVTGCTISAAGGGAGGRGGTGGIGGTGGPGGAGGTSCTSEVGAGGKGGKGGDGGPGGHGGGGGGGSCYAIVGWSSDQALLGDNTVTAGPAGGGGASAGHAGQAGSSAAFRTR